MARERTHTKHGRLLGRAQANTRAQITTEAARIMAEEGVQDFQAAKRKAAGRLNQPEEHNLPSNQEIESALAAHLALFHPDLPQRVRKLRAHALDAMRFFADFEPRLVGMVLTGVVTKFTPVQLHLAADTPEDVAFFLQARAVPYEESDKRLRFGGDRSVSTPCFRFHAGDVEVEACVFSRAAAREHPLSPVDGKPMHRAGLKEVEALITKDEGRGAGGE